MRIIKLWIIYKNEVGFSKIISEMLQEHLEDYFDIFAGNLKKKNLASIIDDDVDFLILCDVIYEEDLGEKMKIWLLNFFKLVKFGLNKEKFISGCYINTTNSTITPSWVDFLQDNFNNTKIFPNIINLKINATKLILEIEAIEQIYKFSEIIIDYILKI